MCVCRLALEALWLRIQPPELASIGLAAARLQQQEYDHEPDDSFHWLDEL